VAEGGGVRGSEGGREKEEGRDADNDEENERERERERMRKDKRNEKKRSSSLLSHVWKPEKLTTIFIMFRIFVSSNNCI